jgi:medium-chain acyl-[acyl-carrier-protein] hydrolase
MFRTWSRSLPTGVEVCPVELPGRGRRMGELPYTQLEPLVTAVLEAVRPVLERPFILFGHSMGALISFELTRKLEQQNLPLPEAVFLAAHRAPHLMDRDRAIHNLPDPQFVEELRTMNGTPVEVLEHKELMELFLPVLRADFAVCEDYSPVLGPPLSCPIVAIGGRRDSHIGVEHLEAWKEYTRSSFRLHMLEGDHFFLHREQQSLLRTLSAEVLHVLRHSSRERGG